MKKNYTLLMTLILLVSFAKGQTNCLVNGDFTNGTNSWFTASSGANCWFGGGTCPSNGTPNYLWTGDQNEQVGVNSIDEDIYQDIYIPYSNVTEVQFFYSFSQNTSETTTSIDYDHISIVLEDQSGNYLVSLGYLSNLNAAPGIPGCKPWSGAASGFIPSSYWGTYARVHIYVHQDGSYPTIFRIDDLNLRASYYCNNYVSNSTFVTPDGTANTYNIANVTTGLQQEGCSWNATVTSGNNWLSCTSSGTGDGTVSISVTANPYINSRFGTIDVAGYTISVEQVGATCMYNLSESIINLPDNSANAYIDIVAVSTYTGCNWTAMVTSGSNWLSTSSLGSSSGFVSILASSNTNNFTRVGIVDVGGSNFTVTQPGTNVGTEELKMKQFSLSPNPASNELTIQKTAELKSTSYNIYNALGEVILSGNLNNEFTKVDVSTIAPGFYFMNLNGESKQSIKFIKE